LVAWQRADDLFIKVHQLTLKAFPPYERYELGRQVRKAAYSVAGNIVEGFERRHLRDRLHFLNIAEAPLAEIGYCIHVAGRLGYLTADVVESLEQEIRMASAPLKGLMRSTRAELLAKGASVVVTRPTCLTGPT
jgi:four helix bundle protein